MSLLHKGQEPCPTSHLSIQGRWKMWWQGGKLRAISSSWKSWRQIEQDVVFPELLKMCLYVILNLGIFSTEYLDDPMVVLIGASPKVATEASTGSATFCLCITLGMIGVDSSPKDLPLKSFVMVSIKERKNLEPLILEFQRSSEILKTSTEKTPPLMAPTVVP